MLSDSGGAISPEDLLQRLEDLMGLLAASPIEQWNWADEHGYPLDELTVQMDLYWPLLSERLVNEGMIDAQDKHLLDTLTSYTDSITNSEHHYLFTFEALGEADEWRQVRVLASEVLSSLARPLRDKAL